MCLLGAKRVAVEPVQRSQGVAVAGKPEARKQQAKQIVVDGVTVWRSLARI